MPDRDAATTPDITALRRMAEKRDPLSVPTWDEVLSLLDFIDRIRAVHREEQRRSADRLRACLESKA